MAAYAATVTSLMTKAVKLDNVVGIYLYSGTVDITNYNQTLAEITAISGKFSSIISVLTEPVTESGYLLRWNSSSKAFEAYYPDAQHSHGLIITKGAIGTNLEVGLAADAAGTTLNNNTISATLTLDAPDPVANASAAAATEVASDTDLGTCGFIAIGLR